MLFVRGSVNSSGFDNRVNATLESHEAVVQPCKPGNAQQLWAGEGEDPSNQSCTNDLCTHDCEKSQGGLPVRDKVQSYQLHGNE